MTDNIDTIKFYTDRQCKNSIKKIEWNAGFRVTLANGESLYLKNTAIAGETAMATFYVRNEGKNKFGMKRIFFSDHRVKILLENTWLPPMEPIKITLLYYVPPKVEEGYAIKEGKFVINGFFVYEE